HDHGHWAALAGQNIQTDMLAMTRYYEAFRPAAERLAAAAKRQTLLAMATRRVKEPAAITFQEESFDDWERAGQRLFRDHCALVGESPENWHNKNIPLMRLLYDAGKMQILTARSNGRMFGYLVSIIGPSLVSEALTSAAHTTFFASPEFPG